MNKEHQRIAIAEACGWKVHPKDRFIVIPPNSPHSVQPLNTIPDYLNDLNAMHEAEKGLDDVTQRGDYWDYLFSLTGGEFEMCHATASQRAEAFLRTLNLWKE